MTLALYHDFSALVRLTEFGEINASVFVFSAWCSLFAIAYVMTGVGDSKPRVQEVRKQREEH